MYPEQSQRILSAIRNIGNIKGVKKDKIKRLLDSDKMLEKHCTRATNMSFDEQRNMKKVLVESADGEQSDYESEPEGELTTIEDDREDFGRSRQEEKLEQKKSRIFKHLTVKDASIKLPEHAYTKKDKLGPFTLFIEIDDVFLHTFLCDENFGYMADSAQKDHEHEFLIEEWKQPVRVYERDGMHEFLSYIKGAKPTMETIIYTTGQQYYTDRLIEIIDPKREIFDHILTQDACYDFVKEDEDIHFLIKDISRFKNRDIRRSVLADSKPLNFIMTPENGLPVSPYDAENHGQGVDEYLLALIEEIEDLRKMKDVRPYLETNYKVRQSLKSAKLI